MSLLCSSSGSPAPRIAGSVGPPARTERPGRPDRSWSQAGGQHASGSRAVQPSPQHHSSSAANAALA
eukprot:8506330-Pyramimonas_sp.AAC.1